MSFYNTNKKILRPKASKHNIVMIVCTLVVLGSLVSNTLTLGGTELDIRSRFPDIRFRLPDIRLRLPDIRFLLPDIRFRLPDLRFRLPDNWFRLSNIHSYIGYLVEVIG